MFRHIRALLGHYVTIFVFLQLGSIAITVLWVMWYLYASNITFLNTYDLAFLITGCVLLGLIILGTVLLFVYTSRSLRLYSQQRSFVSSVTHELRSPIASLKLAVGNLNHQELPVEDRAKVLGLMARDLDRLSLLVEHILVSARLDRGFELFKHKETYVLYDLLNDLLKEAADLNSQIQKNAHLNVDESIRIFTSEPAFRLIFRNIIENAVKYSPPDFRIEIDASQVSSGLLIRVRDYGCGINPKEIRHIFKIFRRGDYAIQNAIRGTGLGLYIVKSTVRVLGGKVWAERADPGTVFHVLLPQTASAK